MTDRDDRICCGCVHARLCVVKFKEGCMIEAFLVWFVSRDSGSRTDTESSDDPYPRLALENPLWLHHAPIALDDRYRSSLRFLERPLEEGLSSLSEITKAL